MRTWTRLASGRHGRCERFAATQLNSNRQRVGPPPVKLPENQKYGLGVSTPRDMVTILEKLERGELVSADASHQMIAILKRCRDDSGIRRRLGAIPIANKTGALDA